MRYPDNTLLWPIPYEIVCEIAEHEGCRLDAYQDIVGVWTIGWGETLGVTKGMRWTEAEADGRFCERLREFSDSVLRLCTVAPNANQLGAMTSLAYNIGVGGFARSTVLRKHNEGDFDAAARAFALWNKAGGKVVRGLTLRRAKEAAMYLTPAADAPVEPMVQRVDPESVLAASPIAQSGAVSAATGSVAAAAAFFEPVRQIAHSLNIDPLMVVGVVALVAGAVVLYQRYKQRNEGWA